MYTEAAHRWLAPTSAASILEYRTTFFFRFFKEVNDDHKFFSILKETWKCYDIGFSFNQEQERLVFLKWQKCTEGLEWELLWLEKMKRWTPST